MTAAPARPETRSLVRTVWNRGLGSRTQIRRLIEAGHVQVNGSVIRRPGFSIRPTSDRIEIRGHPLPDVGPHLYIAFHKPVGVISHHRGPGEVSALDILPLLPRWVFPVGRLDKDTSGLLLLTSDGRWAERVMHPDFGVVREYLAELAEPVDPDALHGGIPRALKLVSRPAQIELVSHRELRLRIREGKRHQVRKMVRAMGGRLTSLRRTAIGPIQLEALNEGGLRNLTIEERLSFRSTPRIA